MRVRLFMEVEINDAMLLKQFGPKLQELNASDEIGKGIARACVKVLRSLPGCDEADVCTIPHLIGPGAQSASGIIK